MDIETSPGGCVNRDLFRVQYRREPFTLNSHKYVCYLGSSQFLFINHIDTEIWEFISRGESKFLVSVLGTRINFKLTSKLFKCCINELLIYKLLTKKLTFKILSNSEGPPPPQ